MYPKFGSQTINNTIYANQKDITRYEVFCQQKKYDFENIFNCIKNTYKPIIHSNL
jgi:hypothetical protein